MLARKSRIQHPLGIAIDTPLLVPSFSSKGFGAHKTEGSEIQEIFEFCSEYLSEVMLISSYDLYYKNLEFIDSTIVELTFVDSGGYETSDISDFSSIKTPTTIPRDWTEDKLKEIYKKWPEHIPTVFVNYDSPKLRRPIRDQIETARDFHSCFPNHLHAFLVKPETKDQQYVKIRNLVPWVEHLQDFDILGLTERELGNSILKRMERIAEIRLAMDDSGISIPIHIYGSLDPITSTLYFLSGAEIFDGLTWLRYGYMGGLACYYHNFGANSEGIGISRTDDFVRGKMIQDNLGHLVDLKHQMQKFLLYEDGDFSKLKFHSSLFRDCYELLRTKNRRI